MADDLVDVPPSSPNWREFERQVAESFLVLGADVEEQVALAGNQVDIVARTRDDAGNVVITAMECKAVAKPVGIEVVGSFAAVVDFLKQRRLIHRASIVSAAGFTSRARQAAKAHGIDLVDFAELERRVQSARLEKGRVALDRVEGLLRTKRASQPKREKHAFVLMPFAPEFDDVYILGLRETAEKLGVTVERADSIEHNAEIINVVQDKIRSADVVIADATGRNVNVFYEIGFAHALNRPTILIARKGEVLPFDIQSSNVIFYETIVHLRDRLEKRLKATLNM